MIKRELQIFFTALMFYTRIPCPKWVNHDPEYLNLSTRYFPLIGWIVGGTSWLVFSLSLYIFPGEISILLSMVASILMTGAFHEDGLADVCDGFGGGWTKEKILLIMKDSRVGTYGVVGLVFVLVLKFYSLSQLVFNDIYSYGLIIVTAHALSRLAAVGIIFMTSYARENEDSKAKPVAQQLSAKNFIIAIFWTVIPAAALLYSHTAFIIMIIPVVIMTVYLRYYFIKWIGGYTGDCLGATQQITEVIIYLSLIVIWRFI